MYRERHAPECDTNTQALMSRTVDDQLGSVFGSLEIPDDWRERMARLAAKHDGGVDIGRLQAKRKRVVRAFLDENISEEEYRRRLAGIDGQIQVAQPASLPTVEEAVALFNDMPALWPRPRTRSGSACWRRSSTGSTWTSRPGTSRPSRLPPRSGCCWRGRCGAQETPPA